MTFEAVGLALDLLLVTAGAAFVVALGFAGAWLSEVVPLGSKRRRWVRRIRAPVAVALFGVYAALAAAHLVAARSSSVAAIAGALLGVAALATFGMLKDVAAGVVLKAAGSCQVGDSIRTQNVSGRVSRMGIRTLALVVSDGDELLVPYSRVSSDLLWLKAAGSALFAHTFVLPVADAGAVGSLFDPVRRRVLLHSAAAVSRPPQVRIVPGGLEVTVFTLQERRGPEIERSVRELVAGQKGP
ncbi:MAG: mechanosensitive ion channel [Polyangiaceae bacterium]|nr:mechanosensitive ion channel [Polyangiaceae bacterium]